MRTSAVGVLALLLLATLPAAEAVEVEQEIVQDDESDVVIQSADGTVEQSDNGQFPNVDLVSAGVWAEDESSVTFFVQVADLGDSSQNPMPFSDPDYRLHFSLGEQGYRLRIDTALQNAINDATGRSGTAFGRLEQEVSEDQFRAIAQAEVEIDPSDDMVRAVVPRAAIVDEKQAPLGLNRTMTDFWATATSMGQFAFPVGQTGPGGDPVTYVGMPAAFDQAPDSLGGILGSYQMTTGELKQKGDLFAVSADPVRWTNGEASTLVYEVQVTNTDDQDLVVFADIRNAKDGWTMAFSDRLTIPAGEHVNATVLATIPFGHNHGAIHMFEAAFESEDGDHVGVADLGVYWPEVPQPAGHHDQIWLHAQTVDNENQFFPQVQDEVHAWLSAKEDEEDDDGSVIPSMFSLPFGFPPGTGNAIAYWQIALEPGLRMGLDLRPDETASSEFAVDLPVPALDPRLTVYLNHVTVEEGGRGQGFSDPVEVASGSSEALSGPTSGRQVFPIEMTIGQEADDIPYEPGSNLVLTVLLEATAMAGGGFLNPEQAAPGLVPGATMMTLPLNEYVEPVDLNFQTTGSLALTAGEDGQQRLVNPGRTVVYAFELSHAGNDDIPVTASITGTNAEWARVVGDASFTLGAQETRLVGLAVTAPRGAGQGERADLTLSIAHDDNAAVQAGINTVTTVDTDTDIPDETERLDGLDKDLSKSKESPGLGLLVLLGAIAIAARRR